MKIAFHASIVSVLWMITGLFIGDYLHLGHNVSFLLAEKHIYPAAKHQNEAQGDQASAGKFVIGQATPDRTEETKKPTDNNHDHWGNRSEIALAVWTFALVCVTSVLAGYTYALWSEAKEARESQSETTRQALSIAKDSADAAVRATEISYAQQRAYVWPGPGRSESLPENKIRIQVTVHNVGQTPCILQTVAWGWCLADDWIWPPVSNHFLDSVQTLDPEIPMEAGRPKNSPVHGAVAEFTLAPPKVFFIRITYLDAFGIRHSAECVHDVAAPGHTIARPGTYSSFRA